jgi:hypothetical protein
LLPGYLQEELAKPYFVKKMLALLMKEKKYR